MDNRTEAHMLFALSVTIDCQRVDLAPLSRLQSAAGTGTSHFRALVHPRMRSSWSLCPRCCNTLAPQPFFHRRNFENATNNN